MELSNKNIASTIRLEDLFSIGIGPSSSHTVGPMRAAHKFISSLGERLPKVASLRCSVLGSLAWTGRGHGTDRAIALGLMGRLPDVLEPEEAHELFTSLIRENRLALSEAHQIEFNPETDIVFDFETPCHEHPNTMLFTALDGDGDVVSSGQWISSGGGFIQQLGGLTPTSSSPINHPHLFSSFNDLLKIGREQSKTISEIVLENEISVERKKSISDVIEALSKVMFSSIEKGLGADGVLPGELKVTRRASGLFQQLEEESRRNIAAPTRAMDYVSAFAIAVNEENAAGGRIVTAPTNGAAGVFPAVLRYYRDFCEGADAQGIQKFFLTATAVGALVKCNASISGAEVGCQGEVGAAAAMAAAGLCAALGGSNAQIENASEIALEHHLGMTCDPIGGLVQVPCIERNAFGAIKAINAASLALRGDGSHFVSFDQVVETMRQTGLDMNAKYKETSRGGLAVNVPEC